MQSERVFFVVEAYLFGDVTKYVLQEGSFLCETRDMTKHPQSFSERKVLLYMRVSCFRIGKNLVVTNSDLVQ